MSSQSSPDISLNHAVALSLAPPCGAAPPPSEESSVYGHPGPAPPNRFLPLPHWDGRQAAIGKRHASVFELAATTTAITRDDDASHPHVVLQLQ